jgi:hypothetical protein
MPFLHCGARKEAAILTLRERGGEEYGAQPVGCNVRVPGTETGVAVGSNVASDFVDGVSEKTDEGEGAGIMEAPEHSPEGVEGTKNSAGIEQDGGCEWGVAAAQNVVPG